ncbi:MAG: DUF2461 domain-containing protein [Clostridiales bacterium]|nr:DUF2461 domain-containing protein [Clostridiales bacterium]
MFQGFTEETIRFFLDLRFHNEVSFYKAHEDEFRAHVKEPFAQFVETMAPTMLSIAEDIETRPSRCVARIRRDTRFSRDKSPFRDHLWVLFRRGGESREGSVMYWFELSPENMAWGLGFWGQNRPAMDALRRKMENKPQEVRRVLRQCGIPDQDLVLSGDRYQRMKPPPGMSLELAMLYPLKDLYVQRANISFDTCYRSDLCDIVAKDYLRLKPLYHLLRAAADEGMAQLDA